MKRRIISIEEASDLVADESRELLNCRLEKSELEWFYFDNNEYKSGDWFENEGGRELICDSEGNILRYEGYYFEIV